MHGQPSFKRTSSDKRNSYTLIPNDLIRDKSISLKAKAILIYLLHLPDDWILYHGQLKEALDVGEEALNSGLKELIEQGYAKRTREKFKGLYQPYRYEISESKIFLPDREIRPDFLRPENPVLLNTNKLNTKEEQQQAPAVAAVVSFEKKENEMKKHTEIYQCLKDTEIPENEKKWLTAKYTSKIIEHALKWALHPETKIKTTFIQALKWACENPIEPPKDEKERIKYNLSECKRIVKRWMQPKTLQIEILSKHVEFIFLESQKNPICISFNEKEFVKKLEKTLEDTDCFYAYTDRK